MHDNSSRDTILVIVPQSIPLFPWWKFVEENGFLNDGEKEVIQVKDPTKASSTKFPQTIPFFGWENEEL